MIHSLYVAVSSSQHLRGCSLFCIPYFPFKLRFCNYVFVLILPILLHCSILMCLLIALQTFSDMSAAYKYNIYIHILKFKSYLLVNLNMNRQQYIYNTDNHLMYRRALPHIVHAVLGCEALLCYYSFGKHFTFLDLLRFYELWQIKFR